MHLSANPYAAYQTQQRTCARGRPLYGEAFATAARLIAQAAEQPQNNRRMAAALSFNHKLWTVVQLDVTEDHPPYSAGLAENLMRLALIVDWATADMLNRHHLDHLDLLSEINRQVAQGLLGRSNTPILEGRIVPTTRP